LGYQSEEGAEGVIDALSVLEAAGAVGQGWQEVGVIGVDRDGVGRAEAIGWIGGEGAALASCGGAMLATGGVA
jgi:hypothetical protein